LYLEYNIISGETIISLRGWSEEAVRPAKVLEIICRVSVVHRVSLGETTLIMNANKQEC